MRRTSPITMIVDAISLMPLMYARSRKELFEAPSDDSRTQFTPWELNRIGTNLGEAHSRRLLYRVAGATTDSLQSRRRCRCIKRK